MGSCEELYAPFKALLKWYLELPARRDVELRSQSVGCFDSLTPRRLGVVLAVAIVTSILVTDVTVTVALTPTRSHTVVDNHSGQLT